VTFPKHAEMAIIEQPGQEIIRDGGNGIIAAKASYKDFVCILFLLCGC
jgi:hypothetical protein